MKKLIKTKKQALMLSTIFPVFLFLNVPIISYAVTYSTNFDTAENPLSEGGNWIQGGDVGGNWTNVIAKNGAAVGTQINPTNKQYDDSVASLTGLWGADQSAEGKVYLVDQTHGGDEGFGTCNALYCPNTSCHKEIELLLRWKITPGSIRGYEILFPANIHEVNPASGSQCIVRWNGPPGDWTILSCLYGQPTIHNGDILKTTMIGNTINVYKNGTLIHTTTDSTYPSGGSPGVGFFTDSCSPAGVYNDNFGFTSFTAIATPPPDTTPPANPTGLTVN